MPAGKEDIPTAWSTRDADHIQRSRDHDRTAGAAFGGIGAAAAGQNILQGMFGGALAGALLAAAVYGGCKAFEGIRSNALEQSGAPGMDSSKMYAGNGASDAGDTDAANIRLLHRLTFAAGASDYNVTNAMEAVASSVMNRVGSPGFPDTLEGVIYQPGQYAEVGSPLWQAWASPGTLSAGNAAAYARALDVARGAYLGTIADPTEGAMWFQSGALRGWHAGRVQAGVLEVSATIGDHNFLRYPR